MSRILFAWELGAGYGHLARQVPIAQRLRARGHEVLFAIRDLRSAALLARQGFRFVQAPLCVPDRRPERPPASYAEMLGLFGFAEPIVLTSLVQGWMTLFDLVRPDALEIDHAPSALLACRLAGIPAVPVGNGFEIPPRGSPLPSIRPWEPIDEARLCRTEQTVLATITAVAQRFSSSPLTHVAALFDMPQRLLATFAELDHYGVRAGEHYAGPIYFDPGGIETNWRPDPARRLFAYVRPNVPGFRNLLTALTELSQDALCAAPGISAAQAQALSNKALRVSAQPVALESIVRRTDVAVSYGGIGTLSPFLLAGVPLLLLPATVEQSLICRRAAATGAAILAKDRSVAGLVRALRALLDDPSYRSRAQAFAARHAGFSPAQPTAAAVHLIETATRSNTTRALRRDTLLKQTEPHASALSAP